MSRRCGALAVAATALLASACSGGTGPVAGAGSQASRAAPASDVSPAPSGSVTPGATAPPGPTGSPRPADPHGLGRYQPLWPFGSAAEAGSWQASYRSGGHQPWHLSPDDTALAFSRFLGFTGIDRVTSRTVGSEGAHIGVGPRGTEGPRTAAVLHLIRLGNGADAPWEVVGTDDTQLSITTPAYGATISSPVTVGGAVTGVDESLRVAVHQRSSGSPAGVFCCVSAGGFPGRWSARVPFRAGADPVLTIVVSAGGHVADVERFAVTGVRKG
ncbi:MAG TPA: hypothetical protein VGP70_00595 [Actinomadura sp.]|nr:hypothetical protein [Actinomadura sp.]